MCATFWSRRPSSAQALFVTALVALVAGMLSFVAARVTPFVVQSHLRVEQGGLEPLYLTPLQEDPARLLLTSRRENSTWTRDRASQGGDTYWVRRYSDPARAGLPPRILLSSRSRGAHLLIPLGALDLEQALAEPLGELSDTAKTPASAPAAQEKPEWGLRSELKRIYWNRAFAGVFLHLRFPERVRTESGAKADALGFDLLLVRGNRLCTTDFLLAPNAELYRALLADGILPAGPFRSNPATGDEAVILLPEDAPASGVPLFSPVSLLDELGLCWGAQLPTIVDDRFGPASAPAYELRPPAAEL
ncbi:MAG: hypothetical protein HOP15_02360, partial [Planctomycetes bacterium]|nr:hypothetical protein [Planctomycetota bacterium]